MGDGRWKAGVSVLQWESEAEAFVLIDHGAELASDGADSLLEVFFFVRSQIATIGGRQEPVQGFLEFAV